MKNALLRLREASASLSAAEQQIARYITENPEEATLLTVRELAQRTFTSPSSVVRVCRSVGFDGYKELRRALVGELAGHPDLVVLRAFTKEYAMAGLRLGYALCSDTALLEKMGRSGPPWAVSTPAQAAGVAALEAEDYRRALRALVAEERPRLQRGLETLGCRVVPGQANYLLFFHQEPDLCPKLRARGVLLRDCGDYAGLGRGWYRAAVRTGRENGIF